MKSTAQILSYIAHPSIMPILGTFFILRFYHYALPSKLQNQILLLVVLGTYILPLIASTILYRMGYISSLLMKKPSDRKLPFMLGTVFFYFTAQLLKGVEIIPVLYIFILSASITIFTQLLFLKQLKISAHAAGISGLITIVIYFSAHGILISPHFIALGILLAAIVGWSRLKLQAHTLTEVVAGYIAGSAPLAFLLWTI
jgi:hypothetical protein